MTREAKARPATKNSAKNGAPRKSGGSTVLGVFIGLVFGVLIAFGLVWYLNKAPMPFQEKVQRPTPDKKESAAAANKPGEPEPLPGKPGDKPVEKPRFEFYNILPGNQDATPAGKPADAKAGDAKPADKPADKAASNEQFYLQVGAFQKPADADNLKAKLALMGVEASVQQATTDKGVLHRVRTGPYSSADEMNRVRNQLAQGGIQATAVKLGNN